MTILVTAANGHLGRLVVDALLARGADPAEVVAGARDTSKLSDLAARGIRTVELDYDRPESIATALDGQAKGHMLPLVEWVAREADGIVARE